MSGESRGRSGESEQGAHRGAQVTEGAVLSEEAALNGCRPRRDIVIFQVWFHAARLPVAAAAARVIFCFSDRETVPVSVGWPPLL